jgi:hypothetical protein
MWFRVCVLCASSPELCFVHVLARWNAVCWSTRPSRWPCTSGAGLVLRGGWRVQQFCSRFGHVLRMRESSCTANADCVSKFTPLMILNSCLVSCCLL